MRKFLLFFFLKLPVSLKLSWFFLICSTGRRMPSINLHYFTAWPNSHEKDFSDFNLLSLNFTARFSDSSVTYFPISFLTNLYSLKTTLLASFKQAMLSCMATGTGKQNGTFNLWSWSWSCWKCIAITYQLQNIKIPSNILQKHCLVKFSPSVFLFFCEDSYRN